MEGADLNKYLATRSYLVGDIYSYADSTLFNLVSRNPEKYEEFCHIQRWLRHVRYLKAAAGTTSTRLDKLLKTSSAETRQSLNSLNELCQKVSSSMPEQPTTNGHKTTYANSSPFAGFGTDACHGGSDPDNWDFAPIVPPISLSTTFKQSAPGKYEKYDYSRAGNPTRTAFEECVAKLEGAKYGHAASSGLAATSLVINMLNAGEHILCCDDVYGGTNRYFNKVVTRFGIEIDMVDPLNLDLFESKLRDNTTLVWLETPTNPTLKICDIAEVVRRVEKRFADKKKPMIVADNTFASPYFQRPLELGATMSLSSVTKYINGHTDVCMGVITTNNEDIAKQLRFLQLAVGPAPSAFDCFLALRGARTLHIRMRQHEANSLTIAKWLENGEKSHHVLKVIHPGLPSHPQHELAKTQMKGFSGMLSFIIDGGIDEATVFLQNLKIFALAESLGGYESLAELPSVMTHASVPAEQRKIIGITDSLIRLSVGIEEPEDLIEDLRNAFNAVYKK